jgi:hypothetical protein
VRDLGSSEPSEWNTGGDEGLLRRQRNCAAVALWLRWAWLGSWLYATGRKGNKGADRTGSDAIKTNQTRSNLGTYGKRGTCHSREQAHQAQKFLCSCDLCAFAAMPFPSENQAESNRIKPNQTCDGEVSMAHGVAGERNGVRRGLGSNQIKPNQTCRGGGETRMNYE